ncbi:MAG: S41 family peptidase [Planctomycetia bacterium]|nr:S41 family peptidase [Planctomycetia bacterium]
MPNRNFVLLVVICFTCLAAFVVREQSAAGRRFGEVLAHIDASYLERVDHGQLLDAAVDAAMSELDEHSAYIRGEDRRDLEAALDQKFGGVGLELMIDEATREPIVATPVVDSPAWRAGVRAGDRIEQIDGKPTAGVVLREIVGRLRGTIGETVVLGIVRPAAPWPPTLDPEAGARDDGERRDVTLVREVIKTESVLGDRRLPDGGWEWMIEGAPGIALVRITTFGERTAGELKAATDAIAATGIVRGLVLDLRGNPGGLLSAAVDVCDLFLDEGVIVHTRGRRTSGSSAEAASLDTRRASPGTTLPDVPLMVLVDGLTASAAEIVAGCLQDAGRAAIIGSRTFGKGTVQAILPLSDDRGLLKLTTSEYLRPSRVNIHRRSGDDDDGAWGVSPDPGYEVAPPAEAVTRLHAWRRFRDASGPVSAGGGLPPAPRGLPREIDPILARAIDGLSGPVTPLDPDFGGEEKTPRDDDHSARPDA